MTDREKLAARIEAAERPTQALFIEAFKVQFGADPMEPGVGKQYRLFLSDGAYLDAAMMLVPEGWRPYTLDMSVKGRSRWVLEGPKTKWVKDDDGYDAAGSDWHEQGIAATPALALSAAAIRAGCA